MLEVASLGRTAEGIRAHPAGANGHERNGKLRGSASHSGEWGAPTPASVDMAQGVAYAHLMELARLLPLISEDALGRAIDLLLDARAKGRRVFVMGNGGSSSTASHFVCDLVKTAHVPGMQPLRAFSLTDNTPLLTAWANDSAYGEAFAQQVAALVEPGDVVIAISASGNSPNIVAGLTAASACGAWTIGLVGFDGGAARGAVDVALHVPAHDYGLVEDAHSAITHALAAAVRQAVRAEADRGHLSQAVGRAHPILAARNGSLVTANGHASTEGR